MTTKSHALVHNWTAAAHPGWQPALERSMDTLLAIATRIGPEPRQPRDDRVLAALQLDPARIRAIIVGQDPYPSPGQPTGLAFAVERHTRPLPPTLRNILTEWAHDTGGHAPAGHTPNLDDWAERGVLLLNRTLTVRPGAVGSHRRLGWENVTAQLLAFAAASAPEAVAVLWGRDAQQAQPLLGALASTHSPHPSPLSARRGFFGSQPFSTVNALRAQRGHDPIDWSLTFNAPPGPVA